MRENDRNVLLTSAGVASAVNVISSLRMYKGGTTRIIAGDMDPLAPGLHIADSSVILPPIKDPRYVERLMEIAKEEMAGALLPMFSGEILLVSKNRDRLSCSGIGTLLSSPETLSMIDDKRSFGRWLEKNQIPCPAAVDPEQADGPVFVKPVTGSSSKGARLVKEPSELGTLKRETHIFQEHVKGQEYTIDFLASEDSELLAAVPRERLEVKDGKAVKARTVELKKGIELLSQVVDGLSYIGPGNLQVMGSTDELKVIELNPRFAAGGLPLATAAGPNIPGMVLDLIFEGYTKPHMEYERGLYMTRYLTEVFLKGEGDGFRRV